jgi:hypothetical protein
MLDALESSGCALQPVATLNNQWMQAFENVYASVATDCHLPQGKNRHHKFKDKIVELWNAMEQEVLDSTNDKFIHTHPLFALGMKQLDQYRSSVSQANSVERKRAAVVVLDNGGGTPGTAARGAGSTPQTAIAVGGTARGKKHRADPLHAAPGPRMLPAGLVGFVGQSQPTEELLKTMHASLRRIENASTQNSVNPKLPSPLGELHRIVVGGMLGDPANKELISPYYNKCLSAFLRVAQEQADSATAPGVLSGVLEGLEVLMRHKHDDVNIRPNLQNTYNYVLKAYLKLIEPQVKLDNNEGGQEASV